jgi:hypothetical protein
MRAMPRPKRAPQPLTVAELHSLMDRIAVTIANRVQEIMDRGAKSAPAERGEGTSHRGRKKPRRRRAQPAR